jgi:hypothetical protein
MPPSDTGSKPDAGRRPATAREPSGQANLLDESWNPDEVVQPSGEQSNQWDWHGRSTWGQRSVNAFPLVAVLAGILIFAAGTAAVSGSPPTVVPGTGGARLVAESGALVPSDPSAPGGTAQYGVVTFPTPSATSYPLEGSTSLALPPYLGWEVNGSAGATDGYADASDDLLHVGVHSATREFRGWFLTTTGSIPSTCAFQFDADSPPAVPASSRGAIGELVMAVQTSSTASSGDINYVLVAEVVHADGERFLQAGYSTGHQANAIEHVLKRVPWAPGPVRVSVETNGSDTLKVWVDGRPFLDATGLDMGIEPPFQPYLEVQAVRTPYVVAFSRYASVCGDDVVVAGLPHGAIASLDGQRAAAVDGQATFFVDRNSPPVTGQLLVALPGASVTSGTRLVRFASHTYWPGQRFRYESGP